MEDFTDLQRLLRLKKYETPAPDFLEDFLLEFHQRQRAEMLKRPLWRLALDRMEAALSGLRPPAYGYVGACAVALLFAGVTANRILTAPTVSNSVASVAANNDLVSVREQVSGFHSPSPQQIVRSPRFDISARRPALTLAELDFDKPRPSAAGSITSARNPRYVLDTRPVSYEQPESF